MTQNIRPSWIEINVDGRANDIATGPRARDGNMSAVIYLRINGEIVRALDIGCIASRDKTTVSMQVIAHDKGLIYDEKFNQ